jgi:hypothetical protein
MPGLNIRFCAALTDPDLHRSEPIHPISLTNQSFKPRNFNQGNVVARRRNGAGEYFCAYAGLNT